MNRLTQKEAIRKALDELGGRACKEDIYNHVIPYTIRKEGANVKASINRTLQNYPMLFRRVEGKKQWWELTSYQEEVENLKIENTELRKELSEKTEIINGYKAVETADEFIKKFIVKVKNNLKRDPKCVEEIRKIMDSLGFPEADKDLDEWLLGLNKRPPSRVTKNYVQTNANCQIFTAGVTNSEFNTCANE